MFSSSKYFRPKTQNVPLKTAPREKFRSKIKSLVTSNLLGRKRAVSACAAYFFSPRHRWCTSSKPIQYSDTDIVYLLLSGHKRQYTATARVDVLDACLIWFRVEGWYLFIGRTLVDRTHDAEHWLITMMPLTLVRSSITLRRWWRLQLASIQSSPIE